MNIAIFTPNKNPYSETFIQAHKTYLKGNIFYYYGLGGHMRLEHHAPLMSTLKRFWFKSIQLLFKKPPYYIWFKSVVRSLKEQSVDVILVEYGTHAQRLLPVLEAVNIPFAVHFHGYDASVKAVIEKNENYKTVFSKASKVFAVSKVMENKLLSIGCPREKLIYNVYGAQPHFCEIEPKFSKLQFIAIGRFVDKKAPYYLIMAFVKVAEKYPNSKLIIAGDGLLVNTCKNLIKQFKLEYNIELVGVISSGAYAHYLTESIAFVQHSITAENGDMEGTPLSVIEASTAGLPVIATYHAGIRDVILHEETGLLCEEHDLDAMTNNMLTVLDNIDYAKKLGQSGKERMSKNYSLERHISVLQDTLEQIV